MPKPSGQGRVSGVAGGTQTHGLVSGLAAVSEKPLVLTLLVVLVSQSTNDPLVAAMARTLHENKGRLDEIKTRLAVRVATWGFVQGPEETRAKVNPYYTK